MLHDTVDDHTNGKHTSETISHTPKHPPTTTKRRTSVSENGVARQSRVATEEGWRKMNPVERPHRMGIDHTSAEETEEEGDQQDRSRPPAPLSLAMEDPLHAVSTPWSILPTTPLPPLPSGAMDDGNGPNAPSGTAAWTPAGGEGVPPPHAVPFSASSFPLPSPDGGMGGVERAVEATCARLSSLSSSPMSSASHHHLGSSMKRTPSKECDGKNDISPSPSHDGVRSAAPSTPPHPLTSFSSVSLEETLPLEHWMGVTPLAAERAEKGGGLWPTWPVSFRVGEAVRSPEREASAASEKKEEEEEEDRPKVSPTRPTEAYPSEEETESVGDGCTTPFQRHPPAWPPLDASGAVAPRDGHHNRREKPIAPLAGKQRRGRGSAPLEHPSTSASSLPSVVSFGSPRFPPPPPPPPLSSSSSSSAVSGLPFDGVGEVVDHSWEGGPRTAADTMASPRRSRCGMPPPLSSTAPSTSSHSSGSEKKRGVKKGGGGPAGGEPRLVDEAPITIAGVNLEDGPRKRLKKVSHYILGPLLGEGMYGVVRDAIDISATPQCVTLKKGAFGSGGGGGGPSWPNATSPSKDAVRSYGGTPGASVPPRTRQAESEAIRVATPPDGGGGRRHTSTASSSSSSTPAAPGHQQFHRCAVKIMTVPPETGTQTHKSLMTGGKRRTAGHSNRAALLRAAFQKEVENLQRFHCPYIMRAMDLFSRYGKEYMVLPIAICSLQEFIVQRRQYAIAGQEWSAWGEEEPRHPPRDPADESPHGRPHREEVDVGHAITEGPSVSAMTGADPHRGSRRRRSRGGPPALDAFFPPPKKMDTPHPHRPPKVVSPRKDGPSVDDDVQEKHPDTHGKEIPSGPPTEDAVIGTVVTRRRKATSSASSRSSRTSFSSSVSSASWPSCTSSSYASSRSGSSHDSHRSYCMACADATSTSSHPSESTSMTDALTSPASLELLPVWTSSSSPSCSPRDFTASGAGGVLTERSTPRSRSIAEPSGAMRFPVPPSSCDMGSGSGSGGSAGKRRALQRGQSPSPPPDTTFLLGAEAQEAQKTEDMREHAPVGHAALHSSPRYSSSRLPHGGKAEDTPHGLPPSSPRNPSALLASLSSSKRSRLPGCCASPHKMHTSHSHPSTGRTSGRFGGARKPTTRPALRSLFSATLIKAAFYQILSAVTYLHQQNLAHNDIKPSNILLFEDGTLRLTDLAGISAHYKDQGTPLFASPELARHYYGCGTEMDATPTRPTPKGDLAANMAATEGIPSPFSSSAAAAPIEVVPPSPAVVPSHTSGMGTTEASPEASTPLNRSSMVASTACPISLPHEGPEEVPPTVDSTPKAMDKEEVEEVDPKACDMWCCGLVLYTMVTGKPGPLPIQLAYDAFHHDSVMEGQHFPINRFQLYRFIADQQTPVNLEDIPHFRTASSATKKEKREPDTTPAVVPTTPTEETEKENPKDARPHSTGSLRDLLSGLLELDPGKRLTAEQALRHPWMELKFIRRGGGGKHTAATRHEKADGRGKADRASRPHPSHHPPFPRHGSLEAEQALQATNAPAPRMHATEDLKGKRNAKQKDDENRRRSAAEEEGRTPHFPPLTSLSADDIVVSSHDIIALSNMAAEYSMNYAIQRQVASRVLASHHFKAMIVKDKQRHLQFVADCCQTLGIPIPHEILLPSASSSVHDRMGEGGSRVTAATGDPTTQRGEGEDLWTRTTAEGGGGVEGSKSRNTIQGMDACIGKVDPTEMETPTNRPTQDGTNGHPRSTWDTNASQKTNEAVPSDHKEQSMAVVEPAMGKVVRDGYCPTVMPPGCVHPHLFLPESEADYYERKNGMPEFDVRSLLDLDDVPLDVMCSVPFVPPRTGSFSHLAPRFSRTTPIKVQQMEEYLHNRLMVELGYRTKPDPFYVAERIGPLSFDAEEEEEEEEEEEDKGETRYASVSNRTKMARPAAANDAKIGTWTMSTMPAAPFSPPFNEDASRRDVKGTTTVVGHPSMPSSFISAELHRSATPTCEGIPRGDRTSTASTENSFSDTVSVRTQESAKGVDTMDKRKQEEIMELKTEKISSEEKRMNKGLSALGSTLSHASFASHRDPTAAAAEVVAKDALSSPPCSSSTKKPVLPKSPFTRPHLTHAKGDLPVSTSAFSLSQKIAKGGEEKNSDNTINHRSNNSGILHPQRTPTNNSFTSFQSGSSTMSSSVLPIPDGKESQSDDPQAAFCDTPARRVKDQSDRNGKRKKKGYSSGSSSKNSNNGMNSAQSVADARRIQESSRCFCGLV